MSMLVRLRPFNSRRGHTMRQYTHVPTKTKFEEKRGWYKVDDKLATYLKTVRQIEHNMDAPRAFDVCTPEKAAAIDRAERRQDAERKSADDAMRTTDVTSDDVQKRLRRPATEPIEPAVRLPDPPEEDEAVDAEDGDAKVETKAGLAEDWDEIDGPGDGDDGDGEDDVDAPEVPEPETRAAAPVSKKAAKKAARAARSMVAAKE